MAEAPGVTAPPLPAPPLLQVQDLRVSYPAARGGAAALAGVSLELAAGECLGLVGESGSGKSQLLLAILGLLPAHAHLSGSVRYRDHELLGLAPPALNRIRGARITMVFQDPMTALNPYLRIGDQISESARVHRRLPRAAAARHAIEMLAAVQIGEPERRARQYPHELSGGMRQRVLLAMALITRPDIVLADEPTTALDVTVQAQILELLQELRARSGAALLLVTHDLGVIARLADRIAVMYAGRIVEQAGAEPLLASPHHPYTEALLRSVARLDAPLPARLASIEGQPPSGSERPPGCAFEPRCKERIDACRHSVPLLLQDQPGRFTACLLRRALERAPSPNA